jgi:phosphopantothenoylcysteine synthetase/decarboxylase
MILGRAGIRLPDEPDELPAANAVVVAPATFNSVNKRAAGITDTFATGPVRLLVRNWPRTPWSM